MRILDKVQEKQLLFVEQDVGTDVYYEIYYLKTKLLQTKNNFNKAVQQWSEVVSKLTGK